ncbi:DUF5331 domain-containing protein [Fischerella sp. PCC 9605]|uniref:DUF5331 domain-containing protein n=1 Tax=Fischerella sp. PCC 9605 TaxID=1173024 RepID=UPI00047DC1EE|nr:DUF5331 domain-containing protein [Fischerella sp. PCC 9605]
MNIQQLRESLKLKWVEYYYKNRPWLVKMRIWGTYDGQRRPSSGFILATLSVLEPQLDQILPFLSELNNNPDQIVAALGLNFNPEEKLHLIEEDNQDNYDADAHHNQINSHLKRILSEKQTNGKANPTLQVALSSSGLHLSERRLETNGVVVRRNTANSKSLVASTATTEVKNHSKSVPTLVVIHKSESKGKPTPLLTVIRKAESNGKPALAVIYKPESNGKPILAPTVIRTTENNSKPVASVVFASKVEGDRQLLPSVVVASDVGSKGKLATIPQTNFKDQFNLAPTNQACKLASWVDGFCQGAGWDKDEAIFISF